MFKRVSVALFYIIVAFTTLVVAGATTTVTVTAAPTSTEPASQCNTGDLQCCDTVEPATSSDATELLGLLGIVLSDLNVLVGITCTPITVIGLGSGGSCTAQPVCCENNNFNGVVNIGCTPVNLGL